MRVIIRIITILCFMFAPIVAQAQFDLYQLSPNESSMGIRYTTFEDGKGLSGNLSYGLSRTLEGFIGAGLLFANDNVTPRGFSIPPAPAFTMGFMSIRPLAKTGLDYLSSADFRVGFQKIIDDATNKTVATTRAMGIGTSLGLIMRIATESNFTLAPFATIKISHGWLATESDAINFSETESDTTYRGSIGLALGISPNVDLLGGIQFSFEESDISYGVSLSFRP